MAGPHVAGLVALVFSAHPGLKGQVDRVETLIEQACVPRTNAENCGDIPGTSVPNNTYGWGRISAPAAVGVGDSDSDGIPDWWEVVFGLNPANAADAVLDPDTDGFSNLEEYQANTDPTNSASRLRVTDVSVDAIGRAAVTWYSRQDGFDAPRRYDLYRSGDLLAGSGGWDRIASNLPPTGTWTTVYDDIGGASTQRFYRVNAVFSGQ